MLLSCNASAVAAMTKTTANITVSKYSNDTWAVESMLKTNFNLRLLYLLTLGQSLL